MQTIMLPPPHRMKKSKNKKADTQKNMINESLTSHKALKDMSKGKTSKMEIWKFVQPYLMSGGKRKVFWFAMACMAVSKGLALGAPY